ncbi:hypothetical protein F441_17486 [Phytophthora nicotianae CJ01A1]|uniref:SET domain-containing protein n=1 Tax=Phytophthora nicotianae CJ01A1 TaxID=1317063 RepID=W2W673_PHYNI|nr:hypothetical protein F441_17486 [Phytophthora nicotianae CJ01A1]
MLLNGKSRKNKYVYIEALECGFTTRFISHSCSPNAAFMEVQNRASVKVLVRMIADVKAGGEITGTKPGSSARASSAGRRTMTRTKLATPCTIPHVDSVLRFFVSILLNSEERTTEFWQF